MKNAEIKEGFNSMISDVMEVIHGSGFEDKESYVESALLHMTKKYEKDLRNAMLEEISNIAHADDELHDHRSWASKFMQKDILG